MEIKQKVRNKSNEVLNALINFDKIENLFGTNVAKIFFREYTPIPYFENYDNKNNKLIAHHNKLMPLEGLGDPFEKVQYLINFKKCNNFKIILNIILIFAY